MIGVRLKKIRKEKGLSQKTLAELLETSSGYISEIEQGKTTPGGKFFHSLNRALLVSIDWLLTGEGSPYLDKEENPPVKNQHTASDSVDLQDMNLLKGFVDKQRALNIAHELIELEKLAPEMVEKVETYIKASVETIKTIAKKDSPPRYEQRKGNRRVAEEPDQVPEGMERRSGMDRRKAS